MKLATKIIIFLLLIIPIGCYQKKTYPPSNVNGYSKIIRDIDIQLEVLFYQKENQNPNPELWRFVQAAKDNQSYIKERIERTRNDQPEFALTLENQLWALIMLEVGLQKALQYDTDKIDELLLQRQELINKYNIDTRICDIHKTPLHQATIKYRGNYLSNEQGYIDSLANEFPNSDEPYTRPLGKLGFIRGIGVGKQPKEIQINVCSECLQARNKWFKDNNIKELSFKEWLEINDHKQFYQSILESLTPM